MKKDDVIRFQAQVARVQTLADGGIRIVLDLSETAIQTATKMMEVRQSGSILEVAAVAIKNNQKMNKEIDGFDFSITFPDLKIERVTNDKK